MTRNWNVVLASVIGLLTVVVGAFAAHGIKDPQTVGVIKTAANWGQTLSVIMVFTAAGSLNRWKGTWRLFLPGMAITVGTVLGSILLSHLPGIDGVQGGEDWWMTGATYGLMHAWAVLSVAALWRGGLEILPGTRIAFLVGILLFSGSLMAMAYGAPRWFGAITPVGGVAFIVGWAMLAWAGFRRA